MGACRFRESAAHAVSGLGRLERGCLERGCLERGPLERGPLDRGGAATDSNATQRPGEPTE